MRVEELKNLSPEALKEKIPFITDEMWVGFKFDDVRAMAKALGVQSPSSKKKGQNIEEMRMIAKGEMEPKLKKEKPGGKKKLALDQLDRLDSKFVQPQFPTQLFREAPKLLDDIAPSSDDDEKPNTTFTESAPIAPTSGETSSFEPREQTSEREKIFVSGILEVMQRDREKTYGFLRRENCDYGMEDVYVDQLISQYSLCSGDAVSGFAVRYKGSSPKLVYIEEVNGKKVALLRGMKRFEKLTADFPRERLRLETENSNDYSLRAIDLVAPLGKGQRGLIVAAPRTGKTTLLKKIATAIRTNNPETHVMVVLVDERPEEITDMRRSVDAEIYASSCDKKNANHIHLAELAIERAKRLAENKKDVVVLFDSLTRLARVYNKVSDGTGKTLSGGVEATALEKARALFAQARNFEEGGSLTILATCLVDTGSKMDDMIFEEMKAVGNMEIVLDRRLSEKRVFPAIDLYKSGTRNDNLLLCPEEVICASRIRKVLSNGNTQEETARFLNVLTRTASNAELIRTLLEKHAKRDVTGTVRAAGENTTEKRL